MKVKIYYNRFQVKRELIIEELILLLQIKTIIIIVYHYKISLITIIIIKESYHKIK